MNSSGFLAAGFLPENNGIYRASADIGGLHGAALAAGLFWKRADLSEVRDQHALMSVFAREFRFPRTFGGNWDALADCLQDLSWLPEKLPRQSYSNGWMLALQGAPGFAGAAPDLNGMLLTVLGATADYWRHKGRVFLVLVEGPVDLPVFPPT